jgi:hypothetical protein
MATDASPEIPPKPATPLTFSETMDYYFEAENDLYGEKSRDANCESTQHLERLVGALRDELTKMADAKGVGEDLRSAMRVEQAAEQRILWIRTTSSEFRNARLPTLLSASLLLSYAFFFIAYAVLDMNWSPALLSGLAIVSMGFCLPWFMDILATHEERRLRKLRGIGDHPRWTTLGCT